jgi:lipooligosaccharide transport system permease protein
LPILEHYLRVYRRTWRGSLFGRLLSPVLMLLSLGFGLGTLVDDGAGITWHGQSVPYVLFVAPAILASTAMMTGIVESSWSVLGAIRWTGTFHAMLATPAVPRDILRAHLAYVTVQVAMAVALFQLVAGAFGAFDSWWVVGCLPIGVLTGLGFSSMMVAVAAKALNDTAFTLVFRLVMAPLMLFSGTFFPVESLPAFLRPIAWATPLWHGVEACRALALGAISWPALAGHVLVLCGFVAGGWWLAGRALRARLVV